jgi:hypothetical protein
MSTNLYEGSNVQVTRFACGPCQTDGPCFQITGLTPKDGDYVIVHRNDAEEVCKAILKDMDIGLSYREND